MSFSVSSSVSSPALLERGMSAFFSTMLAYLATTRLTQHQTQLYGVPAANTLDGGQREHDAGLSLNVGVEDTQDVLEVGWHHQRHGAPSLLSETCTLSTFLNGVAASSTVIKSFFLRGQNCSRDRLLVLLRADPGVGVGNPGKIAVRLVLLVKKFWS